MPAPRRIEFHRRKVDAKRRAPARLAIDGDRAVQRPHDAVHHRQPEARSLAGLLRREKRLEDTLDRRRVHAMAVVADAKPGVSLRAQAGVRPCEGGIHIDRRKPHLDKARALTDGVPGVGYEIRHDLLHLRRIGEHRRRLSVELGADFDGRRNGRAQQLQRFLHDGPQPHRFALLLLRPAEGENLPHEILRALGRFEDLADVRVRGDGIARVLLCQLRKAEDADEDVVEVMRDAAGERADGLHLLRLAQLQLKPRASRPRRVCSPQSQPPARGSLCSRSSIFFSSFWMRRALYSLR